jgi:hypothetical protein
MTRSTCSTRNCRSSSKFVQCSKRIGHHRKNATTLDHVALFYAKNVTGGASFTVTGAARLPLVVTFSMVKPASYADPRSTGLV